MPGNVVDTGHIAVNKRDTDIICQKMIKYYAEKQNPKKGKIYIQTSQLLLYLSDVIILFFKQMRNFLFLRTLFTSSDSQIQWGRGRLQSANHVHLALKNKCPPSHKWGRVQTSVCSCCPSSGQVWYKVRLQCTKAPRGQEGHFIIIYRSEPGYK